jgi:hypothetical protein
LTDSVSRAGCPKSMEPSRWQRIKKHIWGWLLGGEQIRYVLGFGLMLWLASSLMLFSDLSEAVADFLFWAGLFVLGIGCGFCVLALAFRMVKDLKNQS